MILSGYPLYPLVTFAFPVDWAIPEDLVRFEMDWVMSWARIPDVELNETLGHMDWFSKWWQATRVQGMEFGLPLLLMGIAVVGVVITMIRRRTWEPLRSSMWFLPLIAVASIVYWFVTAPDLRFGAFSFWILAISMVLITLNRTRHNPRIILPIAGLLMIEALVSISWHPYTNVGKGLPPDPETGSGYTTTTTNNGVVVHLPHDGLCWLLPLPCADLKRLHTDLALRGTTLEDGFVIRPTPPTYGAFTALNIITQPGDIVPPTQPGTILPADGILVGEGWYDLETWDVGQQRWVNNAASFYITAPTGDRETLCMTAEPRPSLVDGTAQVLVLDASGKTIQEWSFTEETVLSVRLPLNTTQRAFRFMLVAKNGGDVFPNDGRVLNFRVTQMYWCD